MFLNHSIWACYKFFMHTRWTKRGHYEDEGRRDLGLTVEIRVKNRYEPAMARELLTEYVNYILMQ